VGARDRSAPRGAASGAVSRAGRACRTAADEHRGRAGETGEIFDRNGRLLAYSVDADTIYAVPTEIADAAKTAAALCDALEDCTKKSRDELRDRLSQSRSFAFVRRRASPMQAKRVAALGLDGIAFRKESKRYYPNRELAAHLLGYVGVDNVGLSGLERPTTRPCAGARASCWCRPTRAGTCSAGSSDRRPPAHRSS
jgi:cell division protein FtsI/penicillin-binding protein 2